MNRIVQRIRIMLSRREIIPPDQIEELCDEADALQDTIDRIAKGNAERAFRMRPAKPSLD